MEPTEPTHELSEMPPATHVEVVETPLETPTAPPKSVAKRIFMGPFGLRAGWGLLTYICLIFLLVSAIRFVAKEVKHHHHPQTATAKATAPGTSAKPAPAVKKPADNTPMPMKAMITQEGILFVAIFLLSWLMAAIERRRVSAYGLGGVNSVSRFVVGSFWGLVAMGLLVGSLRAFHLLSFDARLQFGRWVFIWGGLQLIGFLLVGLFEEYLFRGYVQFTLTRGLVGLGKRFSTTHARAIAFWTASFITSAIFLLAHTGNGGEDKFGLLSVFLAGVVFVIALWRTGSLWWAIGFHMTWDWSQSFLYGVPDSGGLMQGRLFATHAVGNPLLSGGTVGPEGSVLIIPVLTLIIVVLLLTHRSPQPPLETKAQLLVEPTIVHEAVALPVVD